MHRFAVGILTLGLVACGGGSSGGDGGTSNDPAPRGDRLLSIDLSLPEDGDYVAAFEEALLTDMDQVKLSFDWDELDADMSVVDSIKAFYPAYGMPLVVFIRPIHINQDERPVALQGKAFDDPEVIAGFETLIDDFMAGVGAADIDAIIVGSEIDPYLNGEAAWGTYTTFFAAIADHVHTNHPGVLVGSEVMFELYERDDATEVANWATLCGDADFVGISYYAHAGDPTYQVKPTSAVAIDFATMVSTSIDKPIWLPQVGYPSATSLGSSEAQQADWVRKVFAAWDAHRSEVKMLNFTWMHEWDTAAIHAWMDDVLGISDPSTTTLDDFLGSLGYRTYAGSGSDKPAWPALKAAAAARGWDRDPADIPKPLPQ